DDQTIDLAIDQHADLASFNFAVLFRVGNHHLVAHGLELSGDALGHLRKEGVHQVRYDQAHQIGATGNHAAGNPIGLVVEIPHPLEHAVAGFLADVAVVAQSLRHRHQRHAQIVGNVLHANGQLSTSSSFQLYRDS